MRYEKELKRPDGTKYVIIIGFYFKSYGEGPVYTTELKICLPRKRKFMYVVDTNTFSYRSAPNREQYSMNEILKHVTAQEVLDAKLELWNLLKP